MCQLHESVCANKHQLPLGNAEKGLEAIIADSWPLHGFFVCMYLMIRKGHIAQRPYWGENRLKSKYKYLVVF